MLSVAQQPKLFFCTCSQGKSVAVNRGLDVNWTTRLVAAVPGGGGGT